MRRSPHAAAAIAAVLAAASLFLATPSVVGNGPRAGAPDVTADAFPRKRWIYLSGNLYRDDNAARAESIVRRAAADGYTGVFFSDVKTLYWWKLERPGDYLENARRLRALTRALGLELVVAVFPFGWGESYFAHDPNLAAGLPVRAAPLVRRGSELVPVETAAVENGSFERHRGDRVAGFDLQDDPGEGSFVDTAEAFAGSASIRFENLAAANRHGLGRLFQKVRVEPWQQYRIRVRLKARDLRADNVQVVALAGRRPLQYQALVENRAEGPAYFGAARGLTTDWIEQLVTFNSMNHTTITVGVGVWGWRSGTIWWDDLRVEAVPALNVLRRRSAPLEIRGRRGPYEEGRDFDPVADPRLGRFRWPGTFDTRHERPRIAVPPGSRIAEGETVHLSCYHPTIFYAGQVNATLYDEGLFALCAEEVRRVREALDPDGLFMSHDEIRVAGWEPQQARFGGPGGLLAENLRRCCEIAFREGGGMPVYVWSDMVDPYHNARGGYFLVNGSWAGSWKGLDARVVVVKWGMPGESAKSMRFFERLGHPMMIAAYYDGDVRENRAAWLRSSAGVANVEGVIYTTWRDDYSKLGEFAREWWGGPRQPRGPQKKI